MSISYATENMPENHAKAMSKDLPISTKQSIEICKYLKGKKLQRAKKILQDSMSKEVPIPFTRFNRDMGHKPGIGAGRYPYKSSEAILSLLNSVEANAQVKGLSVSDLYVYSMVVNKASRPWRYGRKKRQRAKRSHIEVVVAQKKQDDVKTEKKPSKKGAAQ